MIPDDGLVFVRDDCLGGPLTALYMIGQARELLAALGEARHYGCARNVLASSNSGRSLSACSARTTSLL